MGQNIIGNLVTVATAIVGIAIVAVLVSKQANTASVITTATTGFGNIIKAAVSPITGGSISGSINPII